MKAPRQQRWIMIGFLFAVVIALHLILPNGHPVRENTGGSAALWAMLAAFGGLILIYRQGLRWLRSKQQPVEPTQGADVPKPTFSESELDRYARHMVLRDIGGVGQKKLKQARVLVIGAGGLGSPVLIYLAAAGVGTLGVIDDDVVDISNLQRQVLHGDQDLGRPKVQSAVDNLHRINPHITVHAFERRLTKDIAEKMMQDYDLVLDGTDNFETRHLVNAASVATKTPLISGALGQWDGTVSLFDPAKGGACYTCAFPIAPSGDAAISCADAGVFAPLPGIIGSMMAAEAVKHITEAGDTLLDRLYLYDALYATSRVLTIKKNPDCPICGGSHDPA